MLTNYNIKYPMVNTRIPGLLDILIIIRGQMPQPSIVPGNPFISKVYMLDNLVYFTVNIPYGSDSYVLDVTSGTTVKDDIEVVVETDDLQLIDAVNAMIETNQNIFNQTSGALEPCTVIWAFSKTISTKYNVNGEHVPIWGENLSFTKNSIGTYILQGSTDAIIEKPKPGINVINGINVSDFKIEVSNSLILETDHSTGTINVRTK